MAFFYLPKCSKSKDGALTEVFLKGDLVALPNNIDICTVGARQGLQVRGCWRIRGCRPWSRGPHSCGPQSSQLRLPFGCSGLCGDELRRKDVHLPT